MRYSDTETTKVVGIFPAGSSVFVQVLNLNTDSYSTLTTNTAIESSKAPGVFIWDTGNITDVLLAPTSFLVLMTDTINTTHNKITVGGYMSEIQDKLNTPLDVNPLNVHSALDSYTNKDEWNSQGDLTEIANKLIALAAAVDGIPVTTLTIEQHDHLLNLINTDLTLTNVKIDNIPADVEIAEAVWAREF